MSGLQTRPTRQPRGQSFGRTSLRSILVFQFIGKFSLACLAYKSLGICVRGRLVGHFPSTNRAPLRLPPEWLWNALLLAGTDACRLVPHRVQYRAPGLALEASNRSRS